MNPQVQDIRQAERNSFNGARFASDLAQMQEYASELRSKLQMEKEDWEEAYEIVRKAKTFADLWNEEHKSNRVGPGYFALDSIASRMEEMLETAARRSCASSFI